MVEVLETCCERLGESILITRAVDESDAMANLKQIE
jgi:hypothetical protein